MDNKMYELIDHIQNKPLYKGFQYIINYVENLEKEKDEALHKLNEFNKDTEIQKLKEELRNIKNKELYLMSDKTFQLRKEFENKHVKKCRIHTVNYELSYISMGTSIVIKCPVCGAEENITDYKEW